MAYAPMFEVWRAEREGAYYEILLDLGRGEDYPLASHPWFLGVRIPMADHREDGEATETEAVRLDLVENRIREVIRRRDGIYVGRRTGAGNRDLVFYMPTKPHGLEDRIRASIGMEILFIVHRDPDWEGYEQLLPTPRDWRQIEDRRTINALLNADADPDRVHRVEHRVITSSRKGAEALARLFERLEIEDIAIEGKRPEISVSGVQPTVLDYEVIGRVSWLLDAKAPKARGEYQGWSAVPELFDDSEADEDDVDMAELLAEAAEALSDESE